MRRLLHIIITAVVLSLSMPLLAIEFKELTEDGRFELYLDSCEKQQAASCLEVSNWYSRNQRLDPIEERQIRSEISTLNEIRLSRDLNEDERASLVYLRSRLGADAQKAKASQNASLFLKRACESGEDLACRRINNTLEYKGSDLLYYSALALIFLAVFIIAKTIFQDEDEFQAQEKLEDVKFGKDELAKQDIVLRYSRPFFKRYFSPIVSGGKNKKKFKARYQRKLASAGLTNIITPEDFFAYKLFLIIGFPIVFMLVRTFLEETWSLQLIPVLAFIGYFYPDISIGSTIKRRQKDIISAMPFCVDMLALSVEAGLDFVAAMSKVIEKAKKTPLTEEFEILIKEIRIGASRGEALRNLAWRIDMIQISSFSATLIAADSVGASIGPILKALSVEIRQKKSAEAEKAGATAATKILFPMLFLIVPAVLLIVFAPMVLGFIYG